MKRVQSSFQALGVGIGLAAIAIVGGSVLVSVAISILRTAGFSVQSNPEYQIALSLILLQGGTFGGISLLYLRHSGHDYVQIRIPTKRDGMWMLGGVVAMFVTMIAVITVLSVLQIHSARNKIVQLGVEDPRVFLLLIPCAFLIIGPGEELFFRGVIQSRLRDAFSPTMAVGLASVIFATAHTLSLVGTFQARVTTIATLFVVSLVLGVAYEWTGNLVVNAFIHGCYDASLFLLAYLSLR